MGPLRDECIVQLFRLREKHKSEHDNGHGERTSLCPENIAKVESVVVVVDWENLKVI